EFATALVTAVAPWHGRILVVDRASAGESTGHGAAVAQAVHGGPGRAGGGEELGGLRAVTHHLQRSAIQGGPELLASIAGPAEGVAAAFDAAEALGPLRTVVHCAGAWDFTRVTELTGDGLDEDYRTNLRSALLTLAAAGSRVEDGGRIVLLSSAAAYLAPGRQ